MSNAAAELPSKSLTGDAKACFHFFVAAHLACMTLHNQFLQFLEPVIQGALPVSFATAKPCLWLVAAWPQLLMLLRHRLGTVKPGAWLVATTFHLAELDFEVMQLESIGTRLIKIENVMCFFWRLP